MLPASLPWWPPPARRPTASPTCWRPASACWGNWAWTSGWMRRAGHGSSRPTPSLSFSPGKGTGIPSCMPGTWPLHRGRRATRLDQMREGPMVQGPTLGGDWAMDSAVAEVLKADFTVSGGQDHTVVLAADLAAALGIEGIGGLGGENTGSGDPVRLCFGLRSCPVNLVVDPGLAAGTLRVGGQIARTLLLPAKGRLGIYWSDPGHLRLGPLIGVLISTTSLASLRRRRNQVYEAFVRYGAEVGATIVFFTINGFKGGRSARRRTRDGRGRRPSQGHLAAYRLQGGRPVRVRTPLPRVIYDRCFGPGSRLQAIRLRHLTRGLGITVINQPVKITKLATYQALRENRRLRAVVPFAAPLSAQALKAAAGRFPVLYVKPDNLSRGWGVVRVRRHGTPLLLERHPTKGRRGWNRILAT